jgi:hypothetical protein
MAIGGGTVPAGSEFLKNLNIGDGAGKANARDLGDLTGKWSVWDDPGYASYAKAFGISNPEYFASNYYQSPYEGLMSYQQWKALTGSMPKPTTPGGGTTPPPGGGGTTPAPDSGMCVNGVCPMPDLPTAYQKPQTIAPWPNWMSQLPGMNGAVQNPLFQYQSMGMNPSQYSGITGLLGQLFKQ